MRVLVLSDIHYPHTDTRVLISIVKKEKPDKLILLGDIINDKGYDKKLFKLVERLVGDNYYFVKGDEDKVNYGLSKLTMEINGVRFLFAHGHKLQMVGDEPVEYIAEKIKSINKNAPLLMYAIVARLRNIFFKGEIVLGHVHALRRFKRLRVTCAGTLTDLNNIYNEKGYVVIDTTGIHTVRLLKK